jgi:hypothetical protein
MKRRRKEVREMTVYEVTESGTYFASKEIEAETEDEARKLYFENPCESDEYEYQPDHFEVYEK